MTIEPNAKSDLFCTRILNQLCNYPKLTHCVFDLDGTLFWSKAFKKATFEQASQCISDVLAIAHEVAFEKIKTHRHDLSKKLGYIPALSTSVCDLGATLEQWGNYQAKVSVQKTIQKDLDLPVFFERIYRKFTIIIYSNMCPELTKEVLTYLGISKFTSIVLNLQVLGATKPNMEVVNSLAKKGVFNPNTTVSVGDRYHIDIEPIVILGGYGFLINSRKELYSFFKKLLNTHEALE